MSDRISDERLEGLSAGYESSPTRYEGRMMADEIIASRALVTELRALAERMRGYLLPDSDKNHYQQGWEYATNAWLDDIDALLAAHDAQQADHSWYGGEVDRDVVREIVELKHAQQAEGKGE